MIHYDRRRSGVDRPELHRTARRTKGRASYLGERSAGHIDPGAASAAILLASLAASIGKEPQDDRHRTRLTQ